MKLLKIKVLIIGIGVLLIAGSMFGQEEDHTRRRDRAAQKKMDHVSKKMAEDLNLTDEQKSEIEEIIKASRKERRAMQTVERSKVDEEIQEVLNSEQQATFKAMKVEREERLTKRKEGQAAIKELREQNIMPFILQKRAELETLLSDEEKAGLQKIRRSKPETSIKGNRRKGKNTKQQRLSKEDRTLLKDISEKYATDIDRLQGEIENNQKSWNEEIQSIKDTYQREDGEQQEKGDRVRRREKRVGKKARKGGKAMGNDIRFLLMDGKS